MIAKDKARELFDKFYFVKDEDGCHSMNKYRAKQCALICVDEILKNCLKDIASACYWKGVKKEINKL